MRWVFIIFFAAILAGGAWAYRAYGPIPPNWIPWGLPQLDSPPTPFAHLQINRLHRDRPACIATLSATRGLKFVVQKDSMKEACGFINVVRVTQSPLPYNNEPVATCGLTGALYWWERDVQRLAVEILQTPLRRIDHLGTFACRNVNAGTVGRMSQHATANAIDIQGFVLADGRRVDVLKHWDVAGPEGVFLKAAHQSACRFFNGVLGPDYNALHANHFHLDLGPYLICR